MHYRIMSKCKKSMEKDASDDLKILLLKLTIINYM